MTAYATTFANPFAKLDNEWEDYGNGDPFVMRHDGSYYLYVSTKDYRTGIKAWSSDDLVNWSYEGLVTEDPVTTGAYAPEVAYWNGKFYLYTSPAGKGHYVYESESPTGPFEKITENVGMSIDGSVFIDDDGSWYFTHAGSQGIVAVEMESPSTFGLGTVVPSAFLGHWTEGSSILKRNGNYYMTYTGNHVFSDGYRIHYSISKDSPVSGYREPAHNPIVISTATGFRGLGHSSTVMGPDLDSYYLVYHNLVGNSAEGPPVRQMNIDHLLFNGDKMSVNGPSNYEQPVPKQADFTDRLDESVDDGRWEQISEGRSGRVISRMGTDDIYTAEFNLRLGEAGTVESRIGVLFSYRDEDHYGMASIDPDKKTITLSVVSDGEVKQLAEAELPTMFDFTRLHTVRIERAEERLGVYVDQMKQMETDAAPFPAGRIGYHYTEANPVFSFTAFSNDAGGSSDSEVLKAVPGTIEAVHYLKGANRGFHVENSDVASDYRKADGVAVTRMESGSYSVRLNGKGDWLKYAVNVSETGRYGIDMTVKASQDGGRFELWSDSESLGLFEVPALELLDGEDWIRYKIGEVELDTGFQTLTVVWKDGACEWATMDLFRIHAEPVVVSNILEKPGVRDIHGQWLDNEFGYYGIADEDAKMYGGDPGWTDYRAEVDIRFSGQQFGGSAGLLFRVTNESDHPHQVSDALMGYAVMMNSRQIQLVKHNYDVRMLEAVKYRFEPNRTYLMRVEAAANRISVYLDDDPVPIIDYMDPDAWLYGKVGIRSQHAEFIQLGNLSVVSLNKTKR